MVTLMCWQQPQYTTARLGVTGGDAREAATLLPGTDLTKPWGVIYGVTFHCYHHNNVILTS